MRKGFENPEERIEDIEAAEAAAYAEKPARDWIAENREKLSEEQLRSLEWFATSEGEKALAENAKDKDETRRLVEDKAFSFFDLDSDNKEVGEATRQLMGAAVSKELQNERLSTAQKLDSIRNIAIRFGSGFREIRHRKSPYEAVAVAERLREEADRKYAGYETRGGERRPLETDVGSVRAGEYLKGALAAALVLEQKEDIEPILGRLIQLSENPQELLGPILSRLAPYHQDRFIDKLLEDNGYIFDSKNNSYRLVETK